MLAKRAAPKAKRPPRPQRPAAERRRAALPAPDPILPPYTEDPDGPGPRARRRLITAGLAIFCLLYGLAYAFFAPYLMLFFAFPILVVAAINIWAMPEARTPPTRALEFLFFAFFIALVMWPNYIALALPGLPWITVARLTGVPLTLAFVLCLSVSPEFRTRLKSTLDAAPLVWKGLLAFVAIQICTLPLSKSPFTSADLIATSQMSWTVVFFVSVFIFGKEGRVRRWAWLVWGMAVAICLIAMVEIKIGHPPWAGHIPKFLQIQDQTVLMAINGGSRAGTNIYRAQATFTSPITLGQYLAFAMPFVIHFFINDRRILVKAAALGSVLLILAIILETHARSGMIGFMIAVMLYTLIWAATRIRRDPGSLLGWTIVLGYPAIGGLVLTVSLFVGRFRRLIWGGGEHTNSNNARQIQYHDGIPLVLKGPLGHGMGQCGQVLNFRLPNGEITIDTYYLAVALDYGIIGFIVYFGFFAMAIYFGGMAAYKILGTRRETSLVAPATIGLLIFIVIDAVFSQTDNHPLVFMMLGMVVALVSRIKAQQAATPGLSPAEAGRQPGIHPGRPRRFRIPAHQPAPA